jgi:hypothetical protein
MPGMTRRQFINTAAFATTAATLSKPATGSAGETPTSKADGADTVEFTAEELSRMFNNRKFPPRAEEPCPLPKSSVIKNIRYKYRHRSYGSIIQADTWLTSWAADGNLYSAYADGSAKRVGVICHIDGVDDWYYPPPHVGFYAVPDRVFGWGNAKYPPKFLDIRKNPTNQTITGNAVIVGDDPFDLSFRVLPPTELTLDWFSCCYPTGGLVKDGTWFYGCQYRNHVTDRHGNQQCFAQGPNRFRISRDLGQTWEWSPFDDHDPVIPEIGACAGGPAMKFGNAHFVDFGRNMEHSPDGYAYLVGHGTGDPEGMSNWSTGDAVFLARVMPTPEAINHKSSYEYFAGRKSDGTPAWSNNFADIKPLFEWASRCGHAYITYFPAVKKYLAVVCAGWPNGGGSQRDTWIAEADALWGPWSIVTYWDAFGEGAYYASIPSKFIKPDGTFILFYSGGWPGPTPIPRELQKESTLIDYPPAQYTLCVAEFQLEINNRS